LYEKVTGETFQKQTGTNVVERIEKNIKNYLAKHNL